MALGYTLLQGKPVFYYNLVVLQPRGSRSYFGFKL
jgi:hypothetical protein